MPAPVNLTSPPPHDCRECGGVGFFEVCTNGHRGNCPCVAREIECEVCAGVGALTCGDVDCGLCATVEEEAR